MLDYNDVGELGERAQRDDVGDDFVRGLAAGVAEDADADVGAEETFRDYAGVETGH